ncbi:hypothetical protein PV326_001442 [Microctonus aethiopoides]|nr:hypothetical protein PV326_001442 [Microctonus aethiopoides]
MCEPYAVKYGINISGSKKSRQSKELHASERTTEHSSKVQQKAAMESHVKTVHNHSSDGPISAKDYYEYHDWSAASCSSSRGNYMSEANMQKPRYECEPNYISHGSVETSKTSNFQPDYAAPLADDMNEMNEVSYFHL